MAYTPLGNPSAPRVTSTTSLMAKKGLNLRDLPQLLSPENALIIRNYLITAEGGLTKRKGLTAVEDAGGTVGCTMLEEYTSNLLVYGYGTSLAVYDIAADTSTIVKSDFNETGFTGVRYGDYFFVASPGDKIGRLTQTLDYDAQSANFNVGSILTGGTSGATAIILEDSDGGTSGTLTLGNISGTFQNDETITDDGGTPGSATADGTVGYTYTEITNAPKAKVIRVVDTRLFAGNLSDEPTAVQYSEVDDGTNPPFTAWSNTTTATAGGKIFYRNAGDVNDINNLGNIVVVFADNGKWAFTIDTIDSGGTLKKIDNTVMYRIDAGGNASLQTKEGLFYVNENGLYQLVSVGQNDIKFSDQEALVSEQLGDDFFEDADFSQASLLKDDVTNTLMITYKNDSTNNNAVLTYNTQLKAYGTITGWNINRFMLARDGTLYGAGSNTAKIWKVLQGNTDDGNDIWYEFEQELNVGALWTRKELLGQYVQGELSPSSQPVIQFDIYDKDGKFVENKLKLRWDYNVSGLTAVGFGDSPWGSPWGGDSDVSGTTEQFAGFRGRIKNFQRIHVNISGNDKVPHTINWLSLDTREKAAIRRRNLTQI